MAYGKNPNGANAFGKCVSKMARMKNDPARAAAVERIGDAADRCVERTTADKGKGKAKGHGKSKSKGRTSSAAASSTLCEVVSPRIWWKGPGRGLSTRRGRDLNPRRSFHHVRDFQSRSLDHSDTSPRGTTLAPEPGLPGRGG